MARMEGLRVRNYGVLRDIQLGRLGVTGRKVEPLSDLTAVIGRNATGKSTLFDAFGFLADCLRVGLEEACTARQRGGFERLRSSGMPDPVQFDLLVRSGPGTRPLRYELRLGLDGQGRPCVLSETLLQGRRGATRGRLFPFLTLSEGSGRVWAGETSSEGESPGREFTLTDRRRLAVATLGVLTEHPRISRFREFIEGWYLSYFTPDAARGLLLAGPQRRLSADGDNLGNVVQYLEREHGDRFQRILKRLASRIPGVRSITAQPSPDGRLLLQFSDRGFRDPFHAQQVSDGTLRLFAYLLLLEDPDPPPLICIEEPDSGLYHKLLRTLAEELREHALRPDGSQVLVTTHQPHFVDALLPEEVWVLGRGDDGFATISRASDDPIVDAMVDQGIPLGSLWYSDHIDPREPADAL